MSVSAPPDRIPLPLHDVLDRYGLARPADVRETVERVVPRSTELQELRPVAESLEWELSQLYWADDGVLPFADNDVPFLINNTGRLSESAAALLFAHCEEEDDGKRITVVELGAGTGLFARFFLDAFRTICEQERRDFYDRLRYVVTDGSRRSMEQWEERAIFAPHHGHVVPGSCDALDLASFRDASGVAYDLWPARAVVCNYLLDVLPCAIVRRGAAGSEELHVRTRLIDDASLAGQYTRLTPEEIRELARSTAAADRARLIPLVTLFEYETAFRPASPSPVTDLALALSPQAERVVANHGAIRCLESCARHLDPRGFILINDYGATAPDMAAEHAVVQRFGGTLAIGLNFPVVERYFAERGIRVLTAPGDDGRSIHTRLLTRADLPRTAAAFRHRFSADADRFFQEPLDRARAHAAAGRQSEALDEYKVGLTRSPRDWQTVGEVAEFVGLRLRDHTAGVELARAAIELNPWYSPWLWNVLGDCLFCLERADAAHDAYLQGFRIGPRDARTSLNLAYTWALRGDFDAALASVASGLAHDASGVYRDRLLDKQQQILAAVAAKALGEQERLVRRMACFRASPVTSPAPT